LVKEGFTNNVTEKKIGGGEVDFLVLALLAFAALLLLRIDVIIVVIIIPKSATAGTRHHFILVTGEGGGDLVDGVVEEDGGEGGLSTVEEGLVDVLHILVGLAGVFDHVGDDSADNDRDTVVGVDLERVETLDLGLNRCEFLEFECRAGADVKTRLEDLQLARIVGNADFTLMNEDAAVRTHLDELVADLLVAFESVRGLKNMSALLQDDHLTVLPTEAQLTLKN